MEPTTTTTEAITTEAAGGMTVQLAHDITSSTITVMGFSFVLGSIFTVLLLMLLDYMRSRREAKTAK